MGTHYLGTPGEIRALNAFIKLTRASDSLTSRVGEHLAQHELTASQFGVLELLLHLGPRCQKDIAQKLLKSGGNITMVIDNLEKRGLVERVRNQEDRRFITVHLTDAGRRLIEEIFPRHVEHIVEEMKALSVKEQEALGELCKRLGKKTEKLE